MHMVLVLLILLAAPLAAAQTVSLQGLITDRVSGDALAGATVRIEGTRLGAVTDKTGRFRFSSVPSGAVTLRASLVGYEAVRLDVYIQPGSATKDVVLTMLASENRSRDVVVTANKRVQAVQDVPISVSVVTQDDISNRAIVNLDDALRYVSGVTVARDQVNIRGASGFALGVGSRTAVLLDGFSLLSGDNGDIKFDVLPVSDVERIEVIKGAGSALYGTGALGGVISMITKTPTESPDISARVYSGAYTLPRYDQWRYRETLPFQGGADVRYAQAYGPVAVSVSGGIRSDESFRDFDQSLRGFGYGKVQWRINDERTLSLQTLYSAENRDNFLFWRSLAQATRTTEDQNPDQKLFSQKLAIGLEYQEILSGTTSLVIRPGAYRTQFENRTFGVVDDSNSSTAWAYNIDAQLTSLVSSSLVLTTGLNSRVNDVSSAVYGAQIQTLFSGYAQGEWTPNKQMILTAGARLDREETRTLEPAFVVSPKLGFTWHVSDASTLRASAGRGFRAPTIAERYANIQYSAIRVIANTGLRPEFSTSIELGLQHKASWSPFPLELDVAIFDNELENMIEPSFTQEGNIKFQNITRARILGSEVTVRAMLAPWLGIETGLTLMSPTDLTTRTTLKYRNNVLWYSRGSLTLAEGLVLQAEYRFLNRVENIDVLAVVQDYDARVPVHIVDARFIWNTSSTVRLTAQVRNLLDYAYSEIMGNLAPTRLLQLQAEYALGGFAGR